MQGSNLLLLAIASSICFELWCSLNFGAQIWGSYKKSVGHVYKAFIK